MSPLLLPIGTGCEITVLIKALSKAPISSPWRRTQQLWKSVVDSQN